MDNFKFFQKNHSNFESCKSYFFEKSLNIGKLEDTKINTFEKFQKFVEKRINETEIKRENTCNFNLNFLVITVISNPKILYQMGKICANSSFKLEMGLLKKSKMNEHLQRKPIRNDFKNLFLEFYRIFLVREIEFVFDINKLKDL